MTAMFNAKTPTTKKHRSQNTTNEAVTEKILTLRNQAIRTVDEKYFKVRNSFDHYLHATQKMTVKPDELFIWDEEPCAGISLNIADKLFKKNEKLLAFMEKIACR